MKRISRRSVRGDAVSAATTVTAYCSIDEEDPGLRPGTLGFARIDCGSRPVREIIRDRVQSLLRTEFWW